MTAGGLSQMMVLMPAMFLMNKIDFKDPFNLMMVRIGFGAVQALIIILSGILFLKITSKKDQTEIKVAPEPKMGQPAPKEKIRMTIEAYDLSQLKKSLSGTLMNSVIVGFIHYKWNVVPPLFLQIVMSPMSFFQLPLVKSHLLGQEVPRPFPAEKPAGLAALLSPPPPEEKKEEESDEEPAPEPAAPAKKDKRPVPAPAAPAAAAAGGRNSWRQIEEIVDDGAADEAPDPSGVAPAAPKSQPAGAAAEAAPAKQEAKAAAAAKARPEAAAEAPAAPKAAAKAEGKAAAKADARPEKAATAEPKPAAKAEPKPAAEAEPEAAAPVPIPPASADSQAEAKPRQRNRPRKAE